MLRYAILLLVATVAADDYSYTVSILRVENPSGNLQNGQPCSAFAFAGTQCSLNLDLQINGQLISLGRISDSSNVAVLSENTYKNWNNPQKFNLSADGIFPGIIATVELKSDTTGEAIDTYTFNPADSTQTQGITSFTSTRGTSITIAWVSTIPAPTTVATTTGLPITGPTTVPQIQTTVTSGPVTAADCEDYPDRKDGVKGIIIGGKVVQVFCQYGATKGSLTSIQSRGRVSQTSFDKTVAQYKSQFGTAGKGADFWLGLENMNSLTSGNISYGLRIDLCCKGNGSVQTYSNVKIGAGPSYILNADTSSSTGLNLMNINTRKSDNGQPFITYRDASTAFMETCDILRFYGGADISKPVFDNSTGGWWFGSCSNNLNGALVPASTEPKYAGTCTANYMTAAGAGIEMRTTTGIVAQKTDDERYFDGISYDRVRMSLYRMDSPVLGLSDNSYCS